MNARELINFIRHALASNFEEFVAVGREVLEKAKGIAPTIFSSLKIPEKKTKGEEIRKIIESVKVRERPSKRAELLYYTEKPDEKIILSFLLKNSSGTKQSLDQEAKEKIINHILDSKRPRELEQVNFTFRISGLSLSILTHIARHRMQSLIVPDLSEIEKSEDYIIPETVRRTDVLEKKYREAFLKSQELHGEMTRKNVPKTLLPYNFLSGNLVTIQTTMNARELYHFLRLRTCLRAQWEVRDIANEMLALVIEAAPLTFKKAGPSCYLFGFCTEGKLTCGKLQKVIEHYKNWHGNPREIPGKI